VEELEKEISELRLAKKELVVQSRSINAELERSAQRERECVYKLHRLRADLEKHDRKKHKQGLFKVGSELKHTKSENVQLSDRDSKLNRSSNQATKYSAAQKLRIAELDSRVTVAERELSIANVAVQTTSEDDTGAVSELQKQLHETRILLNKTTEQLNGTRQRLSEVQERLSVAEQVTAATQQRALQESGNSDELQLELTPQHQSTTRTGDVLISLLIRVILLFSARQHIYYSALYAVAHPSVRHTCGSVKDG